MLDSKLIVIPHRGPIYTKAGVYGPIQTPYYEKTSEILSLLNAGYPVTEVLADKTEVALTYHNYAKDNSGAASAHAEVDAPVPPTPPAIKPVTPPETESQSEQAPLSKQERKRLKRLEEEQKKADGADSDVTPAE